jgi:hypothetical protein
MNPIIPFLKEHWMFSFFAILNGYFVVQILVAVSMSRREVSEYKEMQRQALDLQKRRLHQIESLRYTEPDTFLNVINTLNDDDWQKAKEFGFNILTALMPTKTLEKVAKNKELLAQAAVHGAARKAGLDKDSYIPVKQKEALSSVELHHAKESTAHAINAGLEVNALTHKRRLQISAEIEDWEQELEKAQTQSAKDRISRTIETLKHQYDELGRDTV